MSFSADTASGIEITQAIRAGVTSAREVTEHVLARIESTHARLNAFTTVTADRARREATAVDAALAAGRDPGPLAGVPFTVKNLFDLRDIVTRAGSRINRDDAPATADATAVERLTAAGAICLGAVNMGEYAYDFVTWNAHDGPTHNPRDLTRSAGGSSGGSGASVAAGLGALSLGTDTNGSIRVPAAMCGVWGLKPTYGRLSRAGSFPFVPSLDTIGPLGRSVGDLALAYDALLGADPRDPVCTQRAVEFAAPELDVSIAPLRIARLGGYFAAGGDPAVHAAVDTIARALHSTEVVELPEPALARAAAFAITAAEAGSGHLERLRQRAHDFDPACRDRLLAGALLPASWYLRAQTFRAWWQAQLRELFQHVDVLLAPATPISAPAYGQSSLTFRGEELPLRPNLGVFTQPITLIGLPVVAAPLRPATGLPVAVQLIGAPYTEPRLLRVARTLERLGVCRAPVEPL